MTSADSMLPAEARRGSPFAETPSSRWSWLDERISKLSEYVNPILVKEARQALKSRQFLITFSLLLIASWGVSLVFVSLTYPDVYYAPSGPWILYFYYIALCVPMIVIIPFVAFRSLSGEREDGTFDLVAITTLNPRQIVAGKLGSAVMQMLIYLSALAPAMVFTYMLRGVDIMMIVMLLFYLFLTSVTLSVVGLVLATVTTSRAWQMVLGVIFILALVVLFIIALYSGFGGIFFGSVAYDEPLFWAFHLFVINTVVAYTTLFYLSAMARVTFPSDNRSTKLRICLVVIHAMAIAWAAYFLLAADEWALIGFLIWAAFHWWLMGALMVGETEEISPRVRRELPQTLMGRSFSIWLYPGPGSGYMLMVTCFGCITALMVAISIGSVVADSLATATEVVQGSIVWKAALIGAVVLLAVVGAAVSYALRNQPTAVALFASFFFAIAAGSALLFLIAAMVPADLDIDERIVISSVFFYCYLIIYVGITRVLMMLCNRFVQGGVFLSALISILMVLAASLFVLVVQVMLMGLEQQYTVLQLPDPFWTFYAIMERELTDVGPPGVDVPLEGILLVVGSVFVLLLNLVLSAREVDRQREEVPDRVLEEERQLRPAKTAQETASSPWDDDLKSESTDESDSTE